MKTRLKIKLLIYLILVSISFSVDRYYIICKNDTLYTKIVSMLHHAFSIYLFFGTFIFENYLFNIIIIILTIISWLFYNNRCFLSIYYNKLCDIPEDTPFHDITEVINKRIEITNIDYYVVIFIFIYNVLMFSRKK